MSKFYSKQTKGFYDDTIHTTMPPDATSLSDEEYQALLSGQCEGNVIDFNTPSPTLVDVDSLVSIDDVKSSCKEWINKERDRIMSEGVEYQGVMFDCDDQAKTDVTGVITGIIAGIPLPNNFTWRSKENYDIPMESDDVVGLGIAIMNHRHSILKRSWELKDFIDTLETKTAIRAVDWLTTI